jgi:hypothetical protein
MNKQGVPYSVVTEGALGFFKEDIPLWVVMLLTRIHHFNSRREEKYALYIEKESIKLRVRPEDIILVLEQLKDNGDLVVDKANSGLYLVTLNEELRKNLDLFS